jgi:probable rRNA maturation factor
VSIDIANESGVAVDEVALAAIARYVLDEMRIHPLAELSVLLVDEKAMTELHERWMGEPGPTDVLAFPMDELRPPHLAGGNAGRAGAEEPGPDPGLLGDVVLCPQVAAVQARDAGHSTQGELELLAVHGILHLLGYDHADPGERTEMFGLQDRLLHSWRSGRQEDAAPETSGSPEAGGAGDTPGAEAVPGVSDAPGPDGAGEANGAAEADDASEAAEDSSAGEGGPSGTGNGAPAESLGRQEGSGLCRPRAGW